MPGWTVVLTVVAGYAVFWYLLLSLVGVISGWNKLARRYPAPGPFRGEKYRFRTAGFRWGMNYSGCVTVGADADGLFLAMLWPFRAGHSPIFVPWEDVTATPVDGWLSRYLEFRFADAHGVVVRFERAFGEKIATTAVRAWEGR